jgi:hypothetical protein
VDADDVSYSFRKRQAKKAEDYSTNGILRNQAFLDEIAQALGNCFFRDLTWGEMGMGTSIIKKVQRIRVQSFRIRSYNPISLKER